MTNSNSFSSWKLLVSVRMIWEVCLNCLSKILPSDVLSYQVSKQVENADTVIYHSGILEMVLKRTWHIGLFFVVLLLFLLV